MCGGAAHKHAHVRLVRQSEIEDTPKSSDSARYAGRRVSRGTPMEHSSLSAAALSCAVHWPRSSRQFLSSSAAPVPHSSTRAQANSHAAIRSTGVTSAHSVASAAGRRARAELAMPRGHTMTLMACSAATCGLAFESSKICNNPMLASLRHRVSPNLQKQATTSSARKNRRAGRRRNRRVPTEEALL